MSHLKGFSQKELHKYGWKEGKGLGKVENGIESAIKVKRKNNKGGLGHDHGSDFSFHWWDHIFNKTANSLEVYEDKNGTDTVKINKTSNKTKITPTLMISNKNPCFQYNGKKPLLYGTFVSAGTATIGLQNSDNEKSGNSSDDSSSDEDFSSKDVLERTYKRTGLTGHKAARHGFELNGKLKRIADQEKKDAREEKNSEENKAQTIIEDVTSKDKETVSSSKKKSKKNKKRHRTKHSEKSDDIPKKKRKVSKE